MTVSIRHTVGNCLMSLIISHFVGLHTALRGLQHSNLRQNKGSSLIWVHIVYEIDSCTQ